MAGILTLTLLPVTYALFTGWRRKWRAK